MKNAIILITILSLALLVACGEDTSHNPEFSPADKTSAYSNNGSYATAINDSAFEDLDKTLGELIDKYGDATKIYERYNGANALSFTGTQSKFCFDLPEEWDINDTTFTEDELNLKCTGALYSTVDEIFQKVEEEITDEELGELYDIEVIKNHDGDSYATTNVIHNGFYIYINPKTLGKINPADFVLVKNKP